MLFSDRLIKRTNTLIRFLHPEVQNAARDLREDLIFAYKMNITQTLFEIFDAGPSILIRNKVRGASTAPIYRTLDVLAFKPTHTSVAGFHCRGEIDWFYLAIAAAEAGFVIDNHLTPWRLRYP